MLTYIPYYLFCRSELGVIMETNYYRAVNMSLFLTSSKVIIFVCLLTFVLTDNVLTAEKVRQSSDLTTKLMRLSIVHHKLKRQVYHIFIDRNWDKGL